MSDRVSEINSIVEKIPDIKIVKKFEQSELLIMGSVSVLVEGLEEPLEFEVTIQAQYPFKSRDTETIKFHNGHLLEYKHIMRDGSICIHTTHSPILANKLLYDIDAVKRWITKYYLNKDSDTHYEHLIVPQNTFKESHFAYFFNEVDYNFFKNQYGFVEYSIISNGIFHTENIKSHILQKFCDNNGKEIVDVKWNVPLKSQDKYPGLFIFLKDAPSKNQRWVFENWKDFEERLPLDFLQFLHTVQKSQTKEKGKLFPLFVGYNISAVEIHWQAIMLEMGNFPIYGQKTNQQWFTKLDIDRSIDWAMTRNCSYKYFFGRGRLSDKITNSKILIIGIGAIGSIVAKTLVRCGCTRIDFIDYDVKEPENVCRSEYSFASGINNKTNDLAKELSLISPFFNPVYGGYNFSEAFDFLIKSHLTDEKIKSDLIERLNDYDVIIDCSADNDLLYVLSQLPLKSLLLNISISNHAKQLVCASEQNRYEFITSQFSGNILKFDIDDLYNPIGCWSPTFKASYNDINTLVQFAIKHINVRYEQDRILRNFVIETDESNSLTISLKEF